jgi:GMP synthase-like glutamine amidotransferase
MSGSTKRRVLVVAHDHRSLPGMVGERLTEHGFEIVQVVPADGGEFPSPEEFDVVVAMGAPWCMRDEEVAGWIGDEIAMMRQAVARDVPCSGSASVPRRWHPRSEERSPRAPARRWAGRR